MATIYTQFNIIDNMTAPLYNMVDAANQVVDTMGQIDTATAQGFDSAAIDDARQSVEMVNTQLDETQTTLMANTTEMAQFNQTASSGHSILQKLGTLAAAVGLGLAISTAGSFLYDSATALEATEAKFETVFAGYEEVSQGIVDDFQMLTPASESATRSMTSGIQDLLVPMGFARDAATEMTGETMTLVGALTNFNSATHSATDVASAFQSGLTGEYDSLKSLGVQIDASTVQEQVLAMGLADTTDEITNQMEAQAMLELAYEQSGDALAAYNEESLDTLTRMGLLQSGFTDTFGEAGQSLLPTINDFIILVTANMATLSVMIYGFSDALGVVLDVAGVVFTVLMAIVSVMVDNWSILEPLILGVAVALGLYTGALIVHKLALQGVSAWQAISALHTNVLAAATMMATEATLSATVAQYGLNAALLACPLTWIVLAVVAVVAVFYAAVAAVNHFADTSYSATGLVCGFFAMAGAFIGNVIFGLFNTLTGVGIESYNLVATFANFFANVFNDPVGAIISLFSGAFDYILGIVQSAASLIDTVLKTDMSGAVEGFRNDMADATAEIVGEQTVVMEKMTASDHQLSGFDYGSAWDTGYNFGAGTSIYDDGTVATDDGDMADNLAGIAGDTSDISNSLSATVEELAYLRDLAEVEAINKYTTAEIKVDMGGITNNVSGTADVDGIIDYLVTGVNEAMVSSAKGVHI